MASVDEIRSHVVKVGGDNWGVLADAAIDPEFLTILTTQEQQLLRQLADNPQVLNSYSDYFRQIIPKYLAWQIHKDSNLKTLRKKVSELQTQVEKGKSELEVIQNSAKYIGGATIMVEYAKAFDTTSSNHGTKASEQLRNYLLSLAGFAFIVGLVFFLSIGDFVYIKNLLADDVAALPFYIGVFGLKIFLLFFSFQITQFFRKNYGAEKHLEETYRHRSDTLQSLHAVYNALSDNVEKDRILAAGVMFVYDRGETGYITTKEGAGDGDALVENLVSRFVR